MPLIQVLADDRLSSTPPQRPLGAGLPLPELFADDVAVILELKEAGHAGVHCMAAGIQCKSRAGPPYIRRRRAARSPMSVSQVTGDLPKIIVNEERLYEGDLAVYFRILFFKSRNLHNPYHNLRHMLHVLWLCYAACQYYQSKLSPRQMRNLLIAALFHDFDHPGHPHSGEDDPDRINIPIAIAGLRRYVTPADRPFLPEIEALIEATHYPYKIASDKLDLSGRIIRDADLAQAFSPAWIQQVVIGLAQEWGVAPLEVLKGQASFLAGLSFHTRWARELFPRACIQAKTEEAEQLLRLLQTEPAQAAGDQA
jgi:3'5'-cyclic nucleotide phosphodiesterase